VASTCARRGDRRSASSISPVLRFPPRGRRPDPRRRERDEVARGAGGGRARADRERLGPGRARRTRRPAGDGARAHSGARGAPRVGGGEVAFVVPVEETGRFAFESTPEASWRLWVRRRDGAKQSLGVAVGASEVPPTVLAKGALVSATVRDLDAPRSPGGGLAAARSP